MSIFKRPKGALYPLNRMWFIFGLLCVMYGANAIMRTW